jgi:hypothetical protein
MGIDDVTYHIEELTREESLLQKQIEEQQLAERVATLKKKLGNGWKGKIREMGYSSPLEFIKHNPAWGYGRGQNGDD